MIQFCGNDKIQTELNIRIVQRLEKHVPKGASVELKYFVF